jgi:hypothetical protein
MDSYEVEVKYELSGEAYRQIQDVLMVVPGAHLIKASDAFYEMPGDVGMLRLRHNDEDDRTELTTKKVLDDKGRVRRENEISTTDGLEQATRLVKDLGGQYQFTVTKYAWVADMGFHVTTYEAWVHGRPMRYFFEVEFPKELAALEYEALRNMALSGSKQVPDFADFATAGIVPRLEKFAQTLLQGAVSEGTVKPQPKLLWQVFKEEQ